MKNATTITPSSLFKPNEMFIQTTFVRVCRKKHDLTAEQSERVFESAKATGVLKHVSTWERLQVFRFMLQIQER